MSRRASDSPTRRGQAIGTRDRTSTLRALPSVDQLVRTARRADEHKSSGDASHEAWVQAARVVLAAAREAVKSGQPAPTRADLAARVEHQVRAEQRLALRRVINATGVIVNTNLGRAPLCDAALAAMAEVAAGYSNLEYDLAEGKRGSRHGHIRTLLRELTGAEDALVVNNNAAAMLVVLSALASGREVIVSRGELIEIGGVFRVPDVMLQGGARLVEVGTTNRTRLRDYEAAITDQTALLLAVHPSNYRVVGFTETPELDALCALAHRHGLPLVHDLGSGSLLDTTRWGLAHEPTVPESIAAGVDVVCFSGDKLLGGPQAGIIAGRSALLKEIAGHPLMRAVRIDKLTLAALEATLRQYRDGAALRTLPVWQAIAMPLRSIVERADRWVAALCEAGIAAEVVAGESTVGGGSLPGETLPTALCALPVGSDSGSGSGSGSGHGDLEAIMARLRTGEPALVARISRDHLLLDPRTVQPDEDAALVAAVRAAVDAV